MKDLAVRLAALDPDAGAALRVIAYFDRLTEARAGLQTIVRGAAVLAGCPARLTDDPHRIQVRVQPDGASSPAGEPDPAWMSAPVGGATLWLERPGPPGPVEAMVLERASAAAKAILDRTRRQADPALSELVIDATAAEPLRLQAAARLGHKPTDRVRAIALDDGTAVLLPESAGPPPATRAGIGPTGPVASLPESWAAARIALRFTAEGTEQDPGRRIVHADDLGGLALLATAVTPGSEPIPDVRALERAAATTPWMLTTLDAVAETASLRAAATALRVHHSTLQDRLAHAIPVLGWDVRDPRGRLRLQLALALRRLHRSRH
ncbi:helix-turn-helix domain-containing protein [Paractinoplanes maris]|uniref:helix-turn-helix domain-containing protein n=1 Tax=Paractinoplanes maris TaxID=1734446 RepID=UPI0020227512|nr:helix-turn-helix domain-containing protein [Actinoplanes maris]